MTGGAALLRRDTTQSHSIRALCRTATRHGSTGQARCRCPPGELCRQARRKGTAVKTRTSVDETSPHKSCRDVIFTTALSPPIPMTSYSPHRRLPALLLACVFTASSICMPLAHAQNNNPAAAAAIDYEPPLLDHDVVARGVAGESQVFLASVSDDQALDEVTLFYRFRGDDRFASLPMQPLGESDNYTATVNTSARDVRNIEYYIEARDASGNRVVQGFVFEPLVRVLEPPPVALGESGQTGETPAQGMSLTRKIVYATLGILVVGGVISALDRGGDSGNDSNAGSGGSDTGGDGDTTPTTDTDTDTGTTDTGTDTPTDTGDTGTDGTTDPAAGGDTDDAANGNGADAVPAADDSGGAADEEVPESDAPAVGGSPSGLQLGGRVPGFSVTF